MMILNTFWNINQAKVMLEKSAAYKTLLAYPFRDKPLAAWTFLNFTQDLADPMLWTVTFFRRR